MNDSPMRGLPTPIPRHLTVAPAMAMRSEASASVSLGELAATSGPKYKRRGPAAHRGPAPSLLEQRQAAAKLRRR